MFTVSIAPRAHGHYGTVDEIVDHDDGEYTVRYRAAVSGQYSVVVMLSRTHIEGSPFTLHVQSFKSDAELDDTQAAEVLESYQTHEGSVTLDGVRGWASQDGDDDGGRPHWQDLSLRTFVNVRTGDAIREWNYALGDNDFGSWSERADRRYHTSHSRWADIHTFGTLQYKERPRA